MSAPEIVEEPVKLALAEAISSGWTLSESLEEKMLRTDLAYFAEEMLGMEISDHHKAWSSLTAKYPKLCINAPRDHGKCLAGSSLILMADGTWKRIDQVRSGEFILSEGKPFRINHVWSSGVKPVYEMCVAGGRKIRSTAEHKFWNGDWVELGGLVVGDFVTVVRSNGDYASVKVESIEYVGDEAVYDIEVEKKHEFVADGFRVHNSFMFSFAYAIWRLYYNWIPKLPPGGQFKSIPRVSIGYIFSGTQQQSIALLDIVKTEIQNNEKLRWLEPTDSDATWAKQEIKCSNGAVVRARGYGVSVRGAHPVWIVCDDVLTDETIYSELIRGKQVNYFFSAITPMLVPGGQLIVVGTPFHVQDLYASLKENDQYYFCRYPALDEATETRPLWPTRYTGEMLLTRKGEVGSTRFAREYMCTPINDDSSLFPERILRDCYDPNYEMPSFLTDEDRAHLQVFTGIDLAMSSTVGADFTVITTIGLDRNKNRWIIDVRRKKGLSMSEQLREIADVGKTYRPLKMLIEDNAFQRVFRDELIKNTDLPVEGFTTSAHNKNSLERGVPSLQILFENRKWVIPRKTERDRRVTDILVNELKNFTWVDGKLQGLGAHDDCVMSLYLANEACQSYQFSFNFVGEGS